MSSQQLSKTLCVFQPFLPVFGPIYNDLLHVRVTFTLYTCHLTILPCLCSQPKLSTSLGRQPYLLGKLNFLKSHDFLLGKQQTFTFPRGPSSHFNRTLTSYRRTLRCKYFSLHYYPNRLIYKVKCKLLLHQQPLRFTYFTRWLKYFPSYHPFFNASFFA